MDRNRAIYPTERPQLTIRDDLGGMLQFVQHFDLIPTNALYAWFPSKTYTQKVLTDLMRGHYLGLPLGDGEYGLSDDAREYAKKRNVFYPIAIWPRGEALLANRGLWVARRRQSDGFDHKMNRCTWEFSGRFAARAHGLTVGTEADVLRHPDCPWKPSKGDEHAHHLRMPGFPYHLVPDIFIARFQGAKLFNAHVEIDNGTETQSGKGTTLEAKLDFYIPYIERGIFHSRYGLPNITVLFIFTRPGRMEKFRRLVEEKCNGKKAVVRRIAWACVPSFREEYPTKWDFALAADYERVGDKPLNILETIRDTRAEGREGLRAGHGEEEDRSRNPLASR
jgi:hypothetical protein